MMAEGDEDLADIARRGMPFPVGVGLRHRSDGTPALHPLEEQRRGPRAVERRRIYFSMGRAAAPCAFEARVLKTASAAHPRDAVLEVRCSVVGGDVLSTTYALPGS